LLLLGWSFYRRLAERPLGFDLVTMHPRRRTGCAIVVVGVIGAAIVHDPAAAAGDRRHGAQRRPFISTAWRLDAIAWSVLALEVRMIVTAIAAAVWEPGRLGGFSFAPWLAVLMLFVLSGVFAHGAACAPTSTEP
jgi:hypothetical protein